MKIREIVCKRWFISKRFYGITIYPFIFYRGEPSESLRKHEWAHIKQVEELGWFRFHLTYLWYILKYGYRNNPFEKEARES